MIILDIEEPGSTFDCPFLQEDPDDNTLWCYLSSQMEEKCYGLYSSTCPIVKDEQVINMRNCPNCGAPLEPYRCKCGYCGTWYFDFTAFDMSKDTPYYVKFNTPYGVVTTLAKPELQTIEVQDDYNYAYDGVGREVARFGTSRSCDFGVIFHSYVNPEDGSLYKIELR